MPVKCYAPQSDRSIFYFLDDFVGGGFDSRVWSYGGSVGGSIAKLAALAGQVRITVGGTSGNEYYLTQDTFKNYDTSKFVDLSWFIKIENLTNVAVRCGFKDTTNLIEIIYDSVDSANWIAVATDGTGTTSVTSSLAVDSSWHRLRIIGTAASMDFFVDSMLIATITTHVPSVAAGVIAYGYRNAGDSGTRSFLIDWCEAVGARA
jgi:hypothetical protein